MGELKVLDILTSMDVDVDRVLNSAIGKLKSIIIIGEEHDGTKYFASSSGDGQWYAWLLQLALHKFYNGDFDEYDR